MGLLKRHKCCYCDKMATWYYRNNKKRTHYYCDDCVPRGSYWNVCNISDFGEPSGNNVMWWDSSALAKDMELDGSVERTEKSFYYEVLDDKGRRMPNLNEFNYREIGFPICSENKSYRITLDEIQNAFVHASTNTSAKQISVSVFQDIIEEIFYKYKISSKKIIDYNQYMNKLGIDITNKIKKEYFFSDTQNIQKIYTKFKKEAFKRKYTI